MCLPVEPDMYATEWLAGRNSGPPPSTPLRTAAQKLAQSLGRRLLMRRTVASVSHRLGGGLLGCRPFQKENTAHLEGQF